MTWSKVQQRFYGGSQRDIDWEKLQKNPTKLIKYYIHTLETKHEDSEKVEKYIEAMLPNFSAYHRAKYLKVNLQGRAEDLKKALKDFSSEVSNFTQKNIAQAEKISNWIEQNQEFSDSFTLPFERYQDIKGEDSTNTYKIDTLLWSKHMWSVFKQNIGPWKKDSTINMPLKDIELIDQLLRNQDVILPSSEEASVLYHHLIGSGASDFAKEKYFDCLQRSNLLDEDNIYTMLNAFIEAQDPYLMKKCINVVNEMEGVNENFQLSVDLTGQGMNVSVRKVDTSIENLITYFGKHITSFKAENPTIQKEFQKLDKDLLLQIKALKKPSLRDSVLHIDGKQTSVMNENFSTQTTYRPELIEKLVVKNLENKESFFDLGKKFLHTKALDVSFSEDFYKQLQEGFKDTWKNLALLVCRFTKPQLKWRDRFETLISPLLPSTVKNVIIKDESTPTPNRNIPVVRKNQAHNQQIAPAEVSVTKQKFQISDDQKVQVFYLKGGFDGSRNLGEYPDDEYLLTTLLEETKKEPQKLLDGFKEPITNLTLETVMKKAQTERWKELELKKGFFSDEKLKQIGTLNLESLSLKNCEGIGPQTIKAISGLKELTSLDLTGSNVTSDQIEDLKKALPNCKIVSEDALILAPSQDDVPMNPHKRGNLIF